MALIAFQCHLTIVAARSAWAGFSCLIQTCHPDRSKIVREANDLMEWRDLVFLLPISPARGNFRASCGFIEGPRNSTIEVREYHTLENEEWATRKMTPSISERPYCNSWSESRDLDAGVGVVSSTVPH